ncbi:FAD-binding oxidoreductase [Frankia sp. CcI49]|uniref:FAD-binding and (Fe-S)-binding domain-containing protein n=1 Tax=Frankia sp. CcI49 TaxID=1745382 RepID=UPI000975E951|nr:FAD-binding and (Fe-S)-binding domain-containing protein [Frankia sp. CcI49]ONH50287.1 FAD-binding oxidoreductase [Frankia sp. CcI49]
MSPTDTALLAVLKAARAGVVRARAADRLSHAHDASHYLLEPKAVVVARDTGDVARLLQVSAQQGVPLTFRSGGTSLSGQAGTDGLLVDARQHFQGVEILGDGLRVRVQPGATVRAVNARLARYGRKLGPDPASESACTIGGVVANNSSGMACGTEQNTYRTLESAVLVLPSGNVLDTAEPDAGEQLRALEPDIHAGLLALRDRVRSNADSVATIRRLFSIKNTMGYGVNAFLDHDDPVQLLLRLVVGSEGTLAFVATATFHTVPVQAHAATGLLLFSDLSEATAALPELVAAEFATIELLDATSLRVAQRDPQAGQGLRGLAVRDHAALLVEHQQPTADALADRIAMAGRLFGTLGLQSPGELSRDPAGRSALWHIRKGLYATVAGARPSGTTALLEDIAVPVGNLEPTCRELTILFTRHGYADSVIFGHAKDGNIHFMLNERFDDPALLGRYLAFTDDMVDLVLGLDGTLKAEHGTGRMMAPFVRRQYGDELYDVMRQIKRLLDPSGLLNPGVLLAEDATVHVRHLKSTPTVEAEVDRCVECGYCEPVCPSRDLTTTPRQRIVLRREIVRARQAGDSALADELAADFDYDAVQTCAVDGMCSTACPVHINTGDLTRRLRAEGVGRVAERGWLAAARHWDGASRAAGASLSAAKAMPAPIPTAVTAAARKVLGDDAVPSWSADLPRGGPRRRPFEAEAVVAVYFPACVSTMFGPAAEGRGVQAAFLGLCAQAGVPVRVPEGIASLCCGTPWKSKGLTRGHKAMRDQVMPLLQRATNGGELPVVVDAASCTEGLHTLLADDASLRVLDAVEFVDAMVLPRLDVRRALSSLVVHPTCSSTQLGLNPALLRIAAVVAEKVVVPEDWSCCAFAGDRGLLHPELTASATAAQVRTVAMVDAAAYASLNRTCELGMSRATGRPYRHVLEILAEVTSS